MNLSRNKLLLSEFSKTIFLLFALILFVLFFDSKYFISISDKGQIIANILMVSAFVVLYFKATKRAREHILYATLIGIVGECLFSLVFEMYSYKFGNIPIYVPPGHAIVYISCFYFCRKPMVKIAKLKFEKFLPLLILLYSFAFLIFFQDIFGFVLTILTLWILKNKPRERLFYYMMYLIVVFLELVGTHYQCWSWPTIAFDKFSFLKSANPPSGISFFYFGLDLGSLWLYKQRHKIAWRRMKKIRQLSSL